MVSITNADAFLFFGASLIGLLAGVAGNWFVSSFFRIVDDAVNDYGLNRQRVNLGLFLFGAAMLVLLMLYLFGKFALIQASP